jgi:hypothetical protein
MRTLFLRLAIPAVGALSLGLFATTGASAVTGELEIITNGHVQTIANPTGCVSSVNGSWAPQATIVNDTPETVYLYGTDHCAQSDPRVPLTAGTRATGIYSSVLVP